MSFKRQMPYVVYVFKNVKCLMFDLDGTLVNSEAMAQDVVLQKINDELGLGMSEEEYDAVYLGRDVVFMTRDLESRFGRKLPQGFMPSLTASYHAVVKTFLQASPNVHKALQKTTLPRCVVSNSDLDSIALSLESAGLAKYFDPKSFFSGADVPRPKPAPDVYITAAEVMGFHPSECLAIEDSLAGMTAATNAGVQLIAYAGNTNHARQLATGDVVVIEDFSELAALLPVGLER